MRFAVAALVLAAGVASAQEVHATHAAADSSPANCPAGAYYWGIWQEQHYCVKCPAGTTSAGCSNCAPDPRRTACTATGLLQCERGKFVDNAEATAKCTDCPQGKWQSTTGQTGCYRCPKGMYQPFAGFWSCYKCAVGKFASEYGSTDCQACNTCPRGQYGLTSGQGSDSAESCQCAECGAGRYAPAGYTKCFDCPAGRFQPFGAKDRFSCYYCAPGQYQSNAGQSGCTQCPSGKTTTDRGATSEDTCEAAPQQENHAAVPEGGCAVGSYKRSANVGDNEASTLCVTCPPGYYGRHVAGYGGHCFECGPGSYQPERGATSCLTCDQSTHAPGYAPNAARTECTLLRCAAGEGKTYSKTAGQMVCAKCGPGSFDAGGMCALCSEGRFQSTAGQSSCEPCPEGKLSARGASICTDTEPPTPSPTPSPTPQYFQPGSTSTIQMLNVSTAKIQSSQVVLEAALANLFTWDIHNVRIDRIESAEAPDTIQSCAVLTLTGYADNPQGARLGTFYATEQSVEGRPVYINRATSNYLYYYPAKQWWLVGPTVGSSVAGLLAQSQADYPSEITENFYAFNHETSQWQTSFVGKECSALAISNVKFTLLANDCSANDEAAIVGAPRVLHAGLDTLRNSLDRMEMHASKITVVGQSQVRGCEPEIFLDVPKPSKSVDLPASACHFDGKRVSVLHKGEASRDHDNFACRHRFDENANAFQCNCHSWKSTDAGAIATTAAPAADDAADKKGGDESDAASVDTVTVAAVHSYDEPETVVDCEMGQWSVWTPCDKTCGNGQQTRDRLIVHQPINGGAACEAQSQQRDCGEPCPAPEDCEMNEWGPWSVCSKTCGGGTATRSRTVKSPQQDGGEACPTDTDEAQCAMAECEAHVVPEQQKFEADPYNNWWLTDRDEGDWPEYVSHLPHSGCCITCTSGQPCGTVCIDAGVQCTKSPNSDTWCACHHDVSQELQARAQARQVAKVAATECAAGSYEVAHLPNLCKTCPAGQYQPETNQQSCLECGEGFEPNRIGGATGCVASAVTTPAPAPTSGDVQGAGADDATDCVVAGWPFKVVNGQKKWLWTPCTAACGGGYRSRSRHLIQPTHGGQACPHATEYATCNTQECDGTEPAPQGEDSTEYKEYLHSLEEHTLRAKNHHDDVFYSAVDVDAP